MNTDKTLSGALIALDIGEKDMDAREVKTRPSLLLFFTIVCGLVSSCSSSAPLSTKADATVSPEAKVQTAAPSVTEPTKTALARDTATIASTNTPLQSNVPGLIVTLGEQVPSPWYPGIPVFSPDGQMIALAGSRIRIWDTNTHQLIRELKNPYPEGCYVSQAEFSPDQKYFAASTTGCWKSGNNFGHLLIWDTSTGGLIQDWMQEYAKMPGPNGIGSDYIIPVYAFAFLPDAADVVFSSGNTVETRGILNGEKRDVLKLGSNMYATQISLSSDGRLAYIIMSWEKDHDWPVLWTHKHKFQVWNINTHAMLNESKYPEGWVNLSLKLLGTHLAQIDFENATSQIVNLETDEVQDIPFRRGWRYYNSDGSLMIYARLFGFEENEQAIELWKTDTWRNLYTFSPDFGTDWTYGMHEIAFSPDNAILAIEHQEQVSLWNIHPVVQP